jgi:hypothetical protein
LIQGQPIETSGPTPRGVRGRHRRRGRLASPRADQSVRRAFAVSRDIPPKRMPGRLNCSAAPVSEEARASTLALVISWQNDRPPLRSKRCREQYCTLRKACSLATAALPSATVNETRRCLDYVGERYQALLCCRSLGCSFTLNGSAILSSTHRQPPSNSLIAASTAPGLYEGLLSRTERTLPSSSRHNSILRPIYTNADRTSRTATHSTHTSRHGTRGGAELRNQ